MSIFNMTPTFLYPHSRQFPFDEVAEKIVRELQKRNWNVPGITVDFDDYGSGEAKFRYVHKITGDDFKLKFMRIQGPLNTCHNNIAGIHEIYIPKQSITVYDDESGPTYYLYVGENWEEDKKWFMNSIKVLSKLHGKPRKYLKYKGAYSSNYPWFNTGRKQLLVPDTDLGREYSPQGDEPTKLDCSEKMDEFTTWLNENVLKYILSFSESEIIQFPVSTEEAIPYQGPWDTIYSLCSGMIKEKIEEGKEDINSLLPETRFALAPGRRLVNLSVSCEQYHFPIIAYEGFIWCDVNKNGSVTKYNKILYPVETAMLGLFDSSSYVLAIKPKYSNNIYVADNYLFEEKRQELFKNIAPRDYLTDKEIDYAYAARGSTIVPITEYKGDYKEPIVLINRELDFDEVEIFRPYRRT